MMHTLNKVLAAVWAAFVFTGFLAGGAGAQKSPAAAVEDSTGQNQQTGPPPAPVAPAQPKAPDTTDVNDIMADERGERDYADLCGERLRSYEGLITERRERDSKDPLLSRFNMTDKADKEAFKALKTYCSTGRFRIGTLNDKQECTETIQLTRLHTDLIKHLMTVRTQPAELVMLACVKTPETLSFWTYRAHGILLTHSEIGRVEISGAQISYGVSVFGKTKIPGGISIDSSSLGRIFEINGGEFGDSSKDKAALEIRRSTLEGSLRILNATFASDVYAPANRIEGGLEVVKSSFNGELDLSNILVGTEVSLKDTTIAKNFFMRSCVMRSLKLASLTSNGGMYAKFMKIEGALRIENSKFQKDVELDRVSARQIFITGSTIGSETAPQDGTLSMTAATAGSIAISRSKISSDFFAGNTRTGSFDLKDVKVPSFDCTDCIIEQYMTLGGMFSKEVRLWGAQIKSQLRLRERSACTVWKGTPVFDLRGLQTKAIAADYRDLEITGGPSEPVRGGGCHRATVRTLISGADFEQIIPGYRSATPEAAMPPVEGAPPPDEDFAKCRETASQGSILDHGPAEILCWVREGLDRTDTGKPVYDPRPYQLIASALEKSGRNESGTEIRIAKVEAEDAASVKDFWYWVKKPFKVVSHYVSGYGYHNEWALAWFFALVGLGFFVFLLGRAAHFTGIPHLLKPGVFGLIWYSFWFSVDRAVPPLLLDNSMGEYAMLKPWARYYFYLHRALGTFIISIAIASLTGAFK